MVQWWNSEIDFAEPVPVIEYCYWPTHPSYTNVFYDPAEEQLVEQGFWVQRCFKEGWHSHYAPLETFLLATKKFHYPWAYQQKHKILWREHTYVFRQWVDPTIAVA